jgi:hypothetical protein
VAAALPEIAARYRSTGRNRGEVRRLLATQLAESDGLVRGLLGVFTHSLTLPRQGGED